MDYNPKILREVMELRGINSKTYKLDNGQNQLQGFKTDVHYKDGKELKDIDPNIEGDRVTRAPYIAILTKDKIGFTFKKKETDEEILIELERLGDKEIPYQLPLISGSNAFYEDVDKDIDILIQFNNTGGRMFRILKSPEAEKKAVFHIKQGEKGLRISPKFFGHDSKGRPLNLKTKSMLETDYEVYIEDIFTGQTINIDEKTRVRSLSDEVEYPVKIDPEVSTCLKGLLLSDTKRYRGATSWY